MIIDELKRIMAARGYLPRAALETLSSETGVPLDELYGVASFYPHFRLSPRRGPELGICRDLPCRLAGSARLLAGCRAAAARLGGAAGGAVPAPSGNGEASSSAGPGPLTVAAVSCLGLCDVAPAVAVDDVVYARADPDSGEALVAALAGGAPVAAAAPPRAALGFVAAEGADPDRYGFGVLEGVAASPPERRAEVIARLKAAGLRGLGGAGFPAGSKWEVVAGAPGDRKYAVCNADESEPGTFKDRVLLEEAPHLVLEGLLVGALVVGASEAIVYLRHEYRRAHEALGRAAKRLAALGLSGEGSRTGVRLRLFESPGGYICGEETALLEALEGRRAEPRNKPPYPGTHGLHGRPTLVNNVETLAFVPPILRHGPGWYRAAGAGGSSGRKLLALSGDVARPGVYEVPLGLTASELVEGCGGGVTGGRRLKAFSPGGPSSGFLPASMADVPLDFGPLAKAGSMLGSGGVIVLAEGRCVLAAARSYVEFFKAESCGKCVPCRVGTEKLAAHLDRWVAGARRGERPPAGGLAAFRDPVDDLALTMGQASICGLGQVAALPVTTALAHFRDEVEAHLTLGRCPEGVCDGV